MKARRFARHPVAWAATTLGALMPAAAGAQDSPPPDAPTTLPSVTVSVSRTATPVRELPASVSVVSGVELDKQLSVSTDAFDALAKFVPGLETNSETSFDVSGKGPQLRGRAASVLINGVPVNTLLRSSGFTLGLIDSWAIDRVEVNRGATAAFGFGAPGGLISVQSRRGLTPEPEVTLRTGISANPRKASESWSPRAYLGVGRKKGAGDFHVGLALGRDRPRFGPDGEPVFSQDVSSTNVDATAGLRYGDSGRVEVSANVFRRDFNANYEPGSYYTGYCIDNDFDNCPIGGPPTFRASRLDDAESRAQYQANHLLLVKLTDQLWGQALEAAVYTMRNSFRYGYPASDFVDPPTLGIDRNVMRNDRHGLRTSLTARLGDGERAPALTYGLDYQRDKMIRRRFQGDDLSSGVVAEVRPFAPPVALDSHALFAQLKGHVGPFILSGGLRRETFRPESGGYAVDGYVWPRGRLPSFGATSANLGAVYTLGPDAEVYASISQGLEVSELGRILRDIAARGTPADLSRARARPAKTTQYEIGWRSRAGDLHWTGALFVIDAPLSAQADCSDITEPCAVLRRPERSWGLEATLDWRARADLSLGGSFTWQNGRYEDETGARFRQTNDRMAPPRLSVQASWKPAPGWDVTPSLTHVFSRKPYGDGGYIPYGYEPNTGDAQAYTTVDLAVSREIGDAGLLTLGVENLLNRRYVPVALQADRDLYFVTRAEGTRVAVTYQVSW